VGRCPDCLTGIARIDTVGRVPTKDPSGDVKRKGRRVTDGIPGTFSLDHLPGVERFRGPAAEGRLEDLRIAALAAIAGGRAACTFYEDGGLQIDYKGADDPVTAADHAANSAILRVLRPARPDDSILSEESPPPEMSGVGKRLWVVDPLDGTKEFIAKNGEFSIMIGLAEGGGAVLGAVYQPAIDRLYLGIADMAAWVVVDAQQTPVGKVMSLSSSATSSGSLRFVRSRSHPDKRLAELEAALGEIETVVSGSVGIKCALIARGEADLYVHPVPYLKEWDTCAPEAVLRGAGGTVRDCAGRPLSYGKSDPRQRGGIFAARPEVWNQTEPIVRDVTRSLFEAEAS
jgi:3'(2'), 5'-bisphosphate nucleotidase